MFPTRLLKQLGTWCLSAGLKVVAERLTETADLSALLLEAGSSDDLSDNMGIGGRLLRRTQAAARHDTPDGLKTPPAAPETCSFA